MRYLCIAMALICSFVVPVAPAFAQDHSEAPTDLKAQKTYKEALQYLHDRREDAALDNFKKADKQDGGHCVGCQKNMIKYGTETGDWKAAENAAQEMVSEAKEPRETAIAHYQLGVILSNEASQKHKDELFARSHDEFTKALSIGISFPDALYSDGKVLAHLHHDEEAKVSFQKFVDLRTDEDPRRQRALRYISDPELARARMAPAFAVTAMDGQRIALDDLHGKVVLIDFWATWCGPCREALPHIKEIAKKFQDQPLVILSVDLDQDEQKWKEFVAKNEMSWPQYRDGGFEGTISRMFNVNAIPHTFTIDADGVLQDEHIGDASIEGKLKKLLAQARELQQSAPQQATAKPGN